MGTKALWRGGEESIVFWGERRRKGEGRESREERKRAGGVMRAGKGEERLDM